MPRPDWTVARCIRHQGVDHACPPATAVMPEVEVRSNCNVPLPLTAVTGTVQVMPSLLVGVPIRPVPSVPDRLKLVAATPLTAALKLTVKLSLAARVSAA